MEIIKPNLFNFATSELSQDAFLSWLLSWLLSWADPKFKRIDAELHLCAIHFIQSLFDVHTKKISHIDTIKVKRQDKQIDVLCIVNDEFYILIEDKTNTLQHSDQLVRYRKEIKSRGIDSQNILPIYFKTEEQSNFAPVTTAGYGIYLREDMLKVLKSYTGSNAILCDYRERLSQISINVDSFNWLPSDKWTKQSWRGFYQRLKSQLDAGQWSYVPNKQGGFMAFNWCWHQYQDCRMYVQLEEKSLCVKIRVENKEQRKTLRTFWSNQIIKNTKKRSIKMNKPKRFGNGNYMTVCVLDNYRVFDGEKLEFAKTLAVLQQIESMMKEVYLSMSSEI